MPYYLEKDDRVLLKKLRETSVCAECGAILWSYYDPTKKLPYLCCSEVIGHEGIAKEYEYRELNINSGRERMVNQIGQEKTRALSKYQGVTSLTRQEAMEILETIWPEAPETDKTAAAILCASYGLNPLASHIFLIPFGKGDNAKWARVWGIKAKRLLASRKGGYSYLDMTPRLMTDDEQIKVWGAVDKENLCYITHLKDMKTGAEAYGYGKWPKKDQPYGLDKGNSQANMASIRSESQALDRLRPAEMPTGFSIVDEEYIEGEARVIDIKEEKKPAPERSPEASESTGKPVEDKSNSNPPETTGYFNIEDVKENIKRAKWTEASVISWIKDKVVYQGLKLSGKFEDVIARMNKEQAEFLNKEIEDRLSML